MKTILVVLGGGGHTKQILKLVDMLGRKYNYEYLIGKEDKLSEKSIKIPGKIFRVMNPRKMDEGRIIKVILKFIPSTIQLISIMFKGRAKVVIMCGPAICLHTAILSKLFGKKVIFLESWSRVYTRSWAGNAIYMLKAYNLFFVQWPQEKKNYKNAIYAGRLG